MSSFDPRQRSAIGPRFGEIMGKRCHAAVTAANRGKRGVYDREIAALYEMLRTLEAVTNWTEENDKNETPIVAPTFEPTSPSAGDEVENTEGAEFVGPTSEEASDPDTVPFGDVGPDGAGDDDPVDA